MTEEKRDPPMPWKGRPGFHERDDGGLLERLQELREAATEREREAREAEERAR